MSTKFQLLIKTKIPTNEEVTEFVFIMLINDKMPTIVSCDLPVILGLPCMLPTVSDILSWPVQSFSCTSK